MRESIVPATMVWNQGRPVETLISSSIHEARPPGDHPASPSAARSPYCRGASAARVSIVSEDCSNGEASATPASRGTASTVGGTSEAGALDAASGTAETGSGAGMSRGAVAGGGAAASVFLEKSHMLRVARGACTRVGVHGNERLTRWGNVRAQSLSMRGS